VEQLLSPRDLAEALGVSESSVKRWVDRGELQALRTAGGHRRIDRREAIRFARAHGVTPAKAELLGLAGHGPADADLDEGRRAAAFHHALLDDDRPRAIGLLTSAFLTGASIASLCDGPVRFALEQIGELWKHDERGILYEHRATDTCLHALAALRSALPEPASVAPVALGSAGEDDPYVLPGMMCAAVLAELGFRDVNLGPRTPLATVTAAAQRYRPSLVWRTASVPDADLATLMAALRTSAIAPDVPVLVGGRAVAPAGLPDGIVRLSSMGELRAFATALLATPHAGVRPPRGDRAPRDTAN